MNITTEFKKLWKNERPQADLLVPLLNWTSGQEKSIEVCQDINKKFSRVNRKVLISELSLKNNIRHFIKYPKVLKDDEKTKFFYNDICKYFGWTSRELHKNLSTIDIELLKETIATAFGYDNKQRKLLKLQKLEGISNGKKKKVRVRKDT